MGKVKQGVYLCITKDFEPSHCKFENECDCEWKCQCKYDNIDCFTSMCEQHIFDASTLECNNESSFDITNENINETMSCIILSILDYVHHISYEIKLIEELNKDDIKSIIDEINACILKNKKSEILLQNWNNWN